jgi:hypothetical protein
MMFSYDSSGRRFEKVPIAPETQGIHVVEKSYFIGVDLGQQSDWTAITIIEKCVTGRGALGDDRDGEKAYRLRHLTRPALGTPYPVIVGMIKDIYHHPAMAKADKAVVIDLTGLGRPVYDMMRQAGFEYALNAISITGVNEVTRHGNTYHVPKRDLVSNLQVCLQRGEFKIAAGIQERETLLQEFANFQTRIESGGRDTYGGVGRVHDDTVMSTCMALWLACRDRCNMGDDKYA